MKRKKIILISRCAWTLYNFRAGLIRSLLENSYTVTGGGAVGDGFDKKINALGVPFIPLPIHKKGINPVGDIKLLRALFTLYRKERPGIVHHFTIKPVIYGSIAARLAKVPKIVNTITGLGYVFTDEANPVLKLFVEKLYCLSLSYAQSNFFLNKDDLKLFINKQMVRPEKAELISGEGVDCHFFSPVRRNGSGPVNILMMSRIIKDKGVYDFVDAARIVKKDYPNTGFVLIGERDERNPNVVPLEDIRRWKTEGVIRWLGKVEDVRGLIAESDVVVLPSYYREGIPRSLLEGAAMGKPLITTRTIGSQETVEDGVTGLLVPIKNPGALAQAIIRMIKQPNMRNRMGKAGRKKIECEFEENTIIKNIMKVYSSLPNE